MGDGVVGVGRVIENAGGVIGGNENASQRTEGLSRVDGKERGFEDEDWANVTPVRLPLASVLRSPTSLPTVR
jgi:hypothetical protein